MAQVIASPEMKNYEDKKGIVTLHNKGWVIMIIFTPSVLIYYLIQSLLQNKGERIRIPFQLDSKGKYKMTTLFFFPMYAIFHMIYMLGNPFFLEIL